MATFAFEGLDEYTRQLEQLADPATIQAIEKKAIYAAAGEVTDEIREGIRGLHVSKNVHKGVTPKQLEGLLQGLGISRMRDDNGFLNAKIGFAGYNGHVGKKYPKGQPNVIVARWIEGGTSTAPKRMFIRPALRRMRKKAEETMSKIMDQEISKIMK